MTEHRSCVPQNQARKAALAVKARARLVARKATAVADKVKDALPRKGQEIEGREGGREGGRGRGGGEVGKRERERGLILNLRPITHLHHQGWRRTSRRTDGARTKAALMRRRWVS